MKKTIEQLKADQQKASNAIWELEAERRRTENGPLVGKFFKTRNNYSVPDKRADYWWLYAKVTKMDRSGHLSIVQFEIDKYENLSVRRDDHRWHMADWKQIKLSEFDLAAKKAKALLAKAI